MIHKLLCLLIVIVSLVGNGAIAQSQERPNAFNYTPFYPARWKQANVDTTMTPWVGQHVVFLTQEKTSSKLDAQLMKKFVNRLDDGWSLYGDLVGKSPNLFKQYDKKPTIAAVPPGFSCGVGCGYVGSTGIEVAKFHRSDYPAFEKNSKSFMHYYFYEMGRNYFVFGNKHNVFTTGYAVFMRYVCMDSLKCEDDDTRTRETIESCEGIYAKSKISFEAAFTNLGEGEKGHRLTGANGRRIVPSDQPVMYATAMLKLHDDYGGNEWLKRFYKSLLECPDVKPTGRDQTLLQCMNWLVAASIAAEQDLTPVFVNRWRFPLSKTTVDQLKKIDWSKNGLNAGTVIKGLDIKFDN